MADRPAAFDGTTKAHPAHDDGFDPDADVVQEFTHSNPIVRSIQFFLSFLIPGLGMFSEAYVIFSVGNLKPIFTAAYPSCWKTHKACPATLTNALTYTQVAGIIVGMLVVGFIADRIGRKWGSVVTASSMLIGATLITASDGHDVRALFTMFIIAQTLYGVGVGGEYPVASSSANERANASKKLRTQRGKTVVLVFSNQGLGNMCNTAVILFLMAVTGQYGPHYNQRKLELVWRLSYAIILVLISFMVLWRIFRVKESAQWKKRNAGNATTLTNRKLGLLLGHFSSRIGAASITWFVNDFAFYGNKLFQGAFIKIINPTATLIGVLEWTLLNSVVAYSGYILAAYSIDKRWMGRMRLQTIGFFMSFLLFIICGLAYDTLVKPAYIHWFQALYYLSSFFGQYGPNCTTWLIAAELIPTETRGMAHGWAAAVGKVGAVVAGIVLELISNKLKFIVSAITGIVGVFFTVLFVPDTTFLDLRELDLYWDKIVEGRAHEYHGEAVNPAYLSLFERMVGRGKYYNPELAAQEAKGKSYENDMPGGPVGKA